MLAVIESYTPDEIGRATDALIRHGGRDYFPRTHHFIKCLDRERAKRPSHERQSVERQSVEPVSDDVMDYGILVAWITNRALRTESWRRVAPARMQSGQWESWPSGSDMDDLIPHWLPLASPRAFARVADDLVLARDPFVRGEPDHVSEMRSALRHDLNMLGGRGLRPSERVGLIEARMAELRGMRRESVQ